MVELYCEATIGYNPTLATAATRILFPRCTSASRRLFVYAARAGNSRFGLLIALRAHTKAPYKTNLLWETLRARNRSGGARTAAEVRAEPGVSDLRGHPPVLGGDHQPLGAAATHPRGVA